MSLGMLLLFIEDHSVVSVGIGSVRYGCFVVRYRSKFSLYSDSPFTQVIKANELPFVTSFIWPVCDRLNLNEICVGGAFIHYRSKVVGHIETKSISSLWICGLGSVVVYKYFQTDIEVLCNVDFIPAF